MDKPIDWTKVEIIDSYVVQDKNINKSKNPQKPQKLKVKRFEYRTASQKIIDYSKKPHCGEYDFGNAEDMLKEFYRIRNTPEFSVQIVEIDLNQGLNLEELLREKIKSDLNPFNF